MMTTARAGWCRCSRGLMPSPVALWDMCTLRLKMSLTKYGGLLSTPTSFSFSPELVFKCLTWSPVHHSVFFCCPLTLHPLQCLKSNFLQHSGAVITYFCRATLKLAWQGLPQQKAMGFSQWISIYCRIHVHDNATFCSAG